MATRRSGRDKNRSRTRSKSFPRINTNGGTAPAIRGSRGSGVVGAIASPGMVTTRSRARSRSRASTRASTLAITRRPDAAAAHGQPYTLSYFDARARHAMNPFPVPAESAYARVRQVRSHASCLPQPLDPTGRKTWQSLGGAPQAQVITRDAFTKSFDAFAPTSPHIFPAF